MKKTSSKFKDILLFLLVLLIIPTITIAQQKKEKCRISSNNQILDFIKQDIEPYAKPNNPEGPRISNAELKQQEVKHYANQLKDSRPIRMALKNFSSLNPQDLQIFEKFTSKIVLVLSDCSEVVFFGNTLLGAYELPYNDMLSAFTLATKNQNRVILDFIKKQVTPKPISLYDAINVLMNDFATQQNVIMELLSEEVKEVFFGKNNVVATTDVAEARLLSFSLLGGNILDAQEKLLFFILPKTFKGVRASIGTLVLDIDGNLYEIPNLNYNLSVNILSGLGVNTRTLVLTEVISESSGSCKIDLAGNWVQRINSIEYRGCPFNSIAKRMLKEGTHRGYKDYNTYQAVFEEIENINFNPPQKTNEDDSELGGPAQGITPEEGG